jgi:hypothetical protein
MMGHKGKYCWCGCYRFVRSVFVVVDVRVRAQGVAAAQRLAALGEQQGARLRTPITIVIGKSCSSVNFGIFYSLLLG